MLDGYLDLDSDGWTTLQEFRARTDPQHANPAPPPAQLDQPLVAAFGAAQSLPDWTDLPWVMSMTMRQHGKGAFAAPSKETAHALGWVLRANRDVRLPYDFRIAYEPPGSEIAIRGGGGP